MIDTSPDLREQLIDAEVDHIDAVFLTHEHADQTHGIDDLRSVVLHQRRRIPIYFNQSTAKDIMARFSYCFISPEGSDYPPILTRHSIEAGESREILGKGGAITLTAFDLQHGNIPALGFALAMPPIRRISTTSPRRAGRCSKTSISGSSTACATRRIPATSRSTMRCPGSTASSRSRPSSPICIRISITKCCG